MRAVRPAAGIVDLLSEFVSIPSVSKDEARLADRIAEICGEAGVGGAAARPQRRRQPGRGEPARSFSTPTSIPFRRWKAGRRTRGRRASTAERLIGLGASDAKASVASMLEAFLTAPLPAAGTILFAATCDEETGGEGMEKLVAELSLRRGDRRRAQRFRRRRLAEGAGQAAGRRAGPGRTRRAPSPGRQRDHALREGRAGDRGPGLRRGGPVSRQADRRRDDDPRGRQVQRRPGPLRADRGRADDRRRSTTTR